MLEQPAGIIAPDILDAKLKNIPDIADKIHQVSESIIKALEALDSKDVIPKVRNITLTLVNQAEIFQRLMGTYREIFTIQQRVATLLTSNQYDEKNRKAIQARADEIINKQIFLIQRDVFFKIVNAKEVAEGEKNEDGPALLFPAIEKIKNGIIRNIRSQNEQLYPVAVSICKSFHGIASQYAEIGPSRKTDKAKFDTISQAFEQEQKVKSALLKDLSNLRIDSVDELDAIIQEFKGLRKVYRQKIKSLQDKQSDQVTFYEQKISLLEKGCENLNDRTAPLQVLKTMAARFPALEKQLDFFADSHYQAKAVMKVLEEVDEEVGHIYGKYNIESFTVLSLLKYKLNGTSHMYESIHYYYAVFQIEADIRQALTKRYHKTAKEDVSAVVDLKLEQTKIPQVSKTLHQHIAQMNEWNYDVHNAFLDYKSKPDLEILKKILLDNNKQINKRYENVKSIYKKAQRFFFRFLAEDLGSMDLSTQFDNYLKENKSTPEAEQVIKSINLLLATQKNTLTRVEKELQEQIGNELSSKQVSAMALLKVKKSFQSDLLKTIQEYPHVQEIFVQILKEFIEIQDDSNKSAKNESSIFWLIERASVGAAEKFKETQSNNVKRILKKSTISEKDMAIAFLASNITPQEIESFSRLLPGLPRNELQLDSTYGRILLDTKSLYQEVLTSKSSSLEHLTERIYEKRERLKLSSNICLFLKTCTDPFLKKIDNEEKKVKDLITLQKRKYQKEINGIIRYWQYLIQEQISPGQGERGQFRIYNDDEKNLMAKFLSPDQLYQIEKQLELNRNISEEPQLLEVEDLLFEIISGLFLLFKEDYRIKSNFEESEKNKKIKNGKLQSKVTEDLLDNKFFVPYIMKRFSERSEVSKSS